MCHHCCHCNSCSCSHECGCGCQEGNCHDSCEEKGCDAAHQFLELADEAWMEVLKEKIKDHIRANAKNMDELAKIISEANCDKWKAKMEKKQRCSCYEGKLQEYFHMSSSCSKCKS